MIFIIMTLNIIIFILSLLYYYHYYIIIALNLLLYIIQCHNNENVDIYCHMKTYLNVVYVAMHHVNLFLINFFPYYK